jgi:hypothetical protein
MKCSMCGGDGITDKFTPNVGRCIKCNGTCEIEMTNEEYIRTCSTEELTTLLCALVDTGILNAWTIMYHCADSDSDAVRIWLQKTYEGNKDDNS